MINLISHCWILLLLPITVIASRNRFSKWSTWSPCSRSCDGGIATRQRTCRETQCEGLTHEDKICNIQPCPANLLSLGSDFRDQQCALYNDVPYEGQNYLWEAAADENMAEHELCQLHCRASQNPDLAVKMDREAVDGTRCRMNTLDMCIRGECRRVGCDLQLDSDLKVDQCGTCGGNGTGCPNAIFAWEEAPLSRCSVPCGGGYMMAHFVCLNNQTKVQVHDDLCNKATQPPSRMAPCNNRPCPARWEVTDWSECSKSCGGGVRTRDVACIIDKDGKKIKVVNDKCPNLEPPSKEGCNMEECPQWYTGIWSECSVQCGRRGLQHRNVICRDVRGFPSGACNTRGKPPVSQPCRGPGYGKPDCREEEEGARWKKSQVDSSKSDQTPTGWKKIQGFHVEPPLPRQPLETDKPGSGGPDLPTMTPPGQSPLLPQRLIDSVPTEVTTEASFIVEDWGPCSALCGEGFRKRKVECKIFLEFSKTVATLPDHKCPGPKPMETEICFAGLCDFVDQSQGLSTPSATTNSKNPSSDIQSDHFQELEHPLPALALKIERKISYRWKEGGFTTCSESCLGGIQETKILCVDDSLETAVSQVNCKLSERPEVRVQTCNDHPCPPRWNVSDFSDCSKSCGGGIQTRTVTCIQEVRHGKDNILRVDDSFCPQPPPITQQFCNVIDCPINWNASPWTKCSKKCGSGTMYRKVRCQQLLALGEIANKPEDECPRPRPKSEKTCYDRACTSYDYEPSRHIFRSNDNEDDIGSKSKTILPTIKANFYQAYVQEPGKKTVQLKVGGHATVYEGTKVKIACPVKKFNKSMLKWFKGDQMIEQGGSSRRVKKGKHLGGSSKRRRVNRKRVFVTKKGSLRIKRISYADAGTYSCMAKQATASIDIEVKAPFGTEIQIPDPNNFYDPLRAINKYNKERGQENAWDSSSQADNQVYSQNTAVKDEHGLPDGSGLYGVVKHMTDQPYSFDEFSYGKISPLPGGSGTSTMAPWTQEEQWKIFSRKSSDNHRMLIPIQEHTDKATTSPTVEGYMRFNTVETNSKVTEPKIDGGRWPIQGSRFNDDAYFELDSSSTFWDDLDHLDPTHNQMDNAINPFEHTSVSLSSSSSDSTQNNRSTHILSQVLVVLCLVLGKSLTIMNQKRHLDNNPEEKAGTKDAQKDPGTTGSEENPDSSGSQLEEKKDPEDPTNDNSGTKVEYRTDNEEEGDNSDRPIKLDWKIGEWSRCSQTCGGGGIQVRELNCLVVMSDNSTEVIPASLCIDAGMPEPPRNQSCGQQKCPQWISQQWNKCRESDCVAKNTALQKRDVFCGLEDSSAPALEDRYCEAILKPPTSRQCFTRVCKTTWITSDWSEVSAKAKLSTSFLPIWAARPFPELLINLHVCLVCLEVEPQTEFHAINFGSFHFQCSQSCDDGVQTREVTCIWRRFDPGWKKNSEPYTSWKVLKSRGISGSFCTDLKKPRGSRKCKKTSCTGTSDKFVSNSIQDTAQRSQKVCDDQSQYCGLVHSFKMCHIEKYQVQCCRTCTT
ncbi:protein madd-4-like isoform X2 [Tigriopus californicus]|uniref:protein madd-4-like isoform X2 n=1 Tax=Tigriopus californicus TaxID=6832 RepID=UPI0027DA627C|nr:protein madd-4-like isoform X2 [Tigriopus californicus]